MLSQPELDVGVYSLTVTDAQGCTAFETYTIVDDCPDAGCVDPVIIDVFITDPSCSQGGFIDVLVEEITPNLTFMWSNGWELPQQIALEAGTYSITISDFDPLTGDSCSITETFVLTSQDSLEFFLVSSSPASCNNLGSAEYSNPTLNLSLIHI